MQAIRFEVRSLEKLETIRAVYIEQLGNLPGIHIVKNGLKTFHHNGYFSTITAYANKESFKQPKLGFYNVSAQPLHILKAKVHQSSKAVVGSILKAVGGGLQGSYSYETDFPNYAWIPLPLDYKKQVPLFTEFTIQPQAFVESINYQVDELGNWGAMIYFVPNLPDGTKMDFRWKIAVLTNDLVNSNTDENPEEWLVSTEIVQAADTTIQSTAKQLLATTQAETISQIVSWLASNIEFGVDDSRLDALHVLESKKGACTGYANLAAAFGRALNIPTRTLTVYWVGQKQETHWINEFYLDNKGWQAVEPQGSVFVDSETYIPIRIDKITDEVFWELLKGIPKYAYPIVPFDFSKPDEEYTLVTAFNAKQFATSPKQMNKVFNEARQAWQVDFQTLLNKNKISEKRQALRKQLSKTKSLSKMHQLFIKLGKTD